MSKIVKLGLRQQTEYGLKSRLSRYMIHLQMQQPPNHRYYGAESCTLKRIQYRQLRQVRFSGRRGLANCQSIEARYRGLYQTATIYQRQAGEPWVPIASFTDGQAPVVKLPRPAPTVKMRVVHNALDGCISFINQQAA